MARAREISRAAVASIRQNIGLAFLYNALGVPMAAGAPYPSLGPLVSLSSVSVVVNALRLRVAWSAIPAVVPADTFANFSCEGDDRSETMDARPRQVSAGRHATNRW